MATSQQVEVEAAKLLQKLIHDSQDEPIQLAKKLIMICHHMRMSGKEQTLPYQVISRAMETVISQHGLDMDVLRVPLPGGSVEPGSVGPTDQSILQNPSQAEHIATPLIGRPVGPWHAGLSNMMKEGVYGGSMQKGEILREPKSNLSENELSNPNRLPGPGRLEKFGHDNFQVSSGSQRNSNLFDHESPSSIDTRSANSQDRHDDQSQRKQNRKDTAKRKRPDLTETKPESLQQFDTPNTGFKQMKGRMLNSADHQGYYTSRANDYNPANYAQNSMEQHHSSLSSGAGGMFSRGNDSINSKGSHYIPQFTSSLHGRNPETLTAGSEMRSGTNCDGDTGRTPVALSNTQQNINRISGSIGKVHGGMPGNFSQYGAMKTGSTAPVQCNSSSFDPITTMQRNKNMEASSGSLLSEINKEILHNDTTMRSPSVHRSVFLEKGMNVQSDSASQGEEALSHLSTRKTYEQDGSASRNIGITYNINQGSGSQFHGQPTKENVDGGKSLRNLSIASSRVLFGEQQLKQLRAQCLVFLAFKNGVAPRKLHLEVAFGDNYAKEGGNVDAPSRELYDCKGQLEPLNEQPSTSRVNPSFERTDTFIQETDTAPPSSSLTEAYSTTKDTDNSKKNIGAHESQYDLSTQTEVKNTHLRSDHLIDSGTISSEKYHDKKDDHGGKMVLVSSSEYGINKELRNEATNLLRTGVPNEDFRGSNERSNRSSISEFQGLHANRYAVQPLEGKKVGMIHDSFRHGNPVFAMEKSAESDEVNRSLSKEVIASKRYTTSEKWIRDHLKQKALEDEKWVLEKRKTEERITACYEKLKETVSSSEDTAAKTKSVIELKKLQLLQLQRRLRSDFLNDFFKPIATEMERLKSVKKHRYGRRTKQLEKYEQKMKEERLKRIRERQKEFFSEIESHKERLEDSFKMKRERVKGFNKFVKEFHKRKERIHREKIDRIQREKINLLKINDVEGYLRMVQDAKSDRVMQLLKETEKYLQKLGSKLQEAKIASMEADDNHHDALTAVKNEFTVDNDDENDQAEHYLESNEKYYLMAHSIKESIAEQPKLLLGGKLREYQMNGLRWLVSLYNNHLNGILADEMGLGKTVQVIALICYLMETKNDRGPFLVVVPSSVLPGWVSELNFWAPGINKIAYTGPPEERRRLFKERIVHQKFNVLVTTYEYLMNKHDRPKLSKVQWHYIIIDEGHRIKNASCKLNADLKHYKSTHRLLLTGTPLQNNLEELWALLNFLLPNIFNSSDDFSQWFNKPFEGNCDTSADQALLSEEENLLIINRLHQVLRPFVLRRLKHKVENELPEKIERLVRCEPSAYQKLLMKRVEDNLGAIGSSKGRAVHNSVMELRNICNHPYISQLHTEEVDKYIPKHYLPPVIRLCGKFELLDRLLPKLKATDHRILFFSTMTRLLDVMEEYLRWKGYGYLRLDGHTSGGDRGALIDEFNRKDSSAFIFLLSIRAGGVGVNLQAADTVIIYDTDWNPQVDLQAQARAHRIGQKKDVLVLRLETVRSVEETVRAAAEHKLGVANQSITAGFFDNNTSAEDRREYLESLLRESKKEETASVLEDDALNYLLARSESEIDVFEFIDKQRREADTATWQKLAQGLYGDGLVGLAPTPCRLVTDDDLKEFCKAIQEYEDANVGVKRKTKSAGGLDIQHYGRGKRQREVRSYEEQTEEEFEKLCQAEYTDSSPPKEEIKDKSVIFGKTSASVEAVVTNHLSNLSPQPEAPSLVVAVPSQSSSLPVASPFVPAIAAVPLPVASLPAIVDLQLPPPAYVTPLPTLPKATSSISAAVPPPSQPRQTPSRRGRGRPKKGAADDTLPAVLLKSSSTATKIGTGPHITNSHHMYALPGPIAYPDSPTVKGQKELSTVDVNSVTTCPGTIMQDSRGKARKTPRRTAKKQSVPAVSESSSVAKTRQEKSVSGESLISTVTQESKILIKPSGVSTLLPPFISPTKDAPAEVPSAISLVLDSSSVSSVRENNKEATKPSGILNAPKFVSFELDRVQTDIPTSSLPRESKGVESVLKKRDRDRVAPVSDMKTLSSQAKRQGCTELKKVGNAKNSAMPALTHDVTKKRAVSMGPSNLTLGLDQTAEVHSGSSSKIATNGLQVVMPVKFIVSTPSVAQNQEQRSETESALASPCQTKSAAFEDKTSAPTAVKHSTKRKDMGLRGTKQSIRGMNKTQMIETAEPRGSVLITESIRSDKNSTTAEIITMDPKGCKDSEDADYSKRLEISVTVDGEASLLVQQTPEDKPTGSSEHVEVAKTESNTTVPDMGKFPELMKQINPDPETKTGQKTSEVANHSIRPECGTNVNDKIEVLVAKDDITNLYGEPVISRSIIPESNTKLGQSEVTVTGAVVPVSYELLDLTKQVQYSSCSPDPAVASSQITSVAADDSLKLEGSITVVDQCKAISMVEEEHTTENFEVTVGRTETPVLEQENSAVNYEATAVATGNFSDHLLEPLVGAHDVSDALKINDLVESLEIIGREIKLPAHMETSPSVLVPSFSTEVLIPGECSQYTYTPTKVECAKVMLSDEQQRKDSAISAKIDVAKQEDSTLDRELAVRGTEVVSSAQLNDVPQSEDNSISAEIHVAKQEGSSLDCELAVRGTEKVSNAQSNNVQQSEDITISKEIHVTEQEDSAPDRELTVRGTEDVSNAQSNDAHQSEDNALSAEIHIAKQEDSALNRELAVRENEDVSNAQSNDVQQSEDNAFLAERHVAKQEDGALNRELAVRGNEDVSNMQSNDLLEASVLTEREDKSALDLEAPLSVSIPPCDKEVPSSKSYGQYVDISPSLMREKGRSCDTVEEKHIIMKSDAEIEKNVDVYDATGKDNLVEGSQVRERVDEEHNVSVGMSLPSPASSISEKPICSHNEPVQILSLNESGNRSCDVQLITYDATSTITNVFQQEHSTENCAMTIGTTDVSITSQTNDFDELQQLCTREPDISANLQGSLVSSAYDSLEDSITEE